MSTYTPKVGDTVRSAEWRDSEQVVVVTAVGRELILAVDDDGESVFPLLRPWVKVEPTPADRYAVWVNGRDNDLWSNWYTCLVDATEVAERHEGRVARFSFAEWVVPGE